ncbi:MAG: hypothetical protein Q7U14_03755 [Lacisediminimonas sp.]|nr:hypothetical protein [Lacisediminimonas sp.]
MKIHKNNAVRMFVLAGLAAAVLAGCEKKEDTGSAEKLGRKIDQAAAQGAVELHKMGEQAGKALEKAGEKLQGKSDAAKPDDKQQEDKK